jgi:anti-sigma factor RsiW
MGRWHWLHVVGKGEGRLAAYAAGELPPADRLRLEAQLAECPDCRQSVRAYRMTSAAVRSAPRAVLTAEEATAFLPGVHRRVAQRRVGGLRPTRPGLREVLWDHPRLSLASAIMAALLVVSLTMSQLQFWGTSGLNGVDIISVDVDENASVMVFQAPGSSLKIIWVFEDTSS